MGLDTEVLENNKVIRTGEMKLGPNTQGVRIVKSSVEDFGEVYRLEVECGENVWICIRSSNRQEYILDYFIDLLRINEILADRTVIELRIEESGNQQVTADSEKIYTILKRAKKSRLQKMLYKLKNIFKKS